MGNLHSNELNINIDDLKNQIFGCVINAIGREHNPRLKFYKEYDRCNGDNLPLLEPKDTTTYSQMSALIKYYGTDRDRDDQIEEYVNKHILDSKSNYERFIKTISTSLARRKTHLSVLSGQPTGNNITTMKRPIGIRGKPYVFSPSDKLKSKLSASRKLNPTLSDTEVVEENDDSEVEEIEDEENEDEENEENEDEENEDEENEDEENDEEEEEEEENEEEENEDEENEIANKRYINATRRSNSRFIR